MNIVNSKLVKMARDDFFGEDPFESIVKELFGGRPARSRSNNVIRGEEEDRNIDFIETEGGVYVVFEIPGYDEEDVDVSVKGKEIQIQVQKKNTENIQAYLMQKLGQGNVIRKVLPDFINPKKFKSSIKNGVLEIAFNKR